MTPTRTRIPSFKSEREEAEWWDAHPEVVTALFLKAKKEGKIKRLPVIRGATRSTTIRLPIADIETAQQIAERRGFPYQTYLKGLLHQALERERMYDPEEFRQERERLRAEIEATRTAEGKEQARQIRKQRATYEALPNARKTERDELEVFNAFADVADIAIVPRSGVNAPSPEPDIRCTMRHYFELGEITDPSLARRTADSIKNDAIRGGFFSQDEPLAYIIKKKRDKKYRTNGAEVELLLYYRTQSPPPSSNFAKLTECCRADLEALVTSGRFQRVWIFDFERRQVLWRSPA